MKYLLLLLFFPLISPGKPVPQQKGAPGLSENVVMDYPEALQKAGVKRARCVFKDSRNLIWIGTENGLYRYDGTNIDNLRHQVNTNNTIPDNTVVSIAEDKHSNIWVGTMAGIARIDPYTLKCTIYTKASKNIKADFDNKIFADQDGGIWVGNSTGLYLLNKKETGFKLVWSNVINGANGATYITSLTHWKGDTLVAGTFVDAVLINKRNFHFRRLHIAENNLTINRLFVDSRKRIWMGSWANGCIISDDQCKTFTTLKWEKTAGHRSENIVTGIIETNYNHDDNLWISTFSGIYKIPGYLRGEKTFTILPVITAPNLAVNNMMADDDQYIWLVGYKIARFFAGEPFFKRIGQQVTGDAANIQQLDINNKKYVALSSWYSTSGLLILDSQGKAVYRQNRQANQDNANISGVAVDKFNRIWISAFNGIKILNNRFMAGAPLQNSRLTTVKTNNIMINHDTVWITGYKSGVDLFDLNFRKLRSFLKNDGSGLKDNLIERLFVDSKGTTWLCGDDYLYRYDAPRSKFISYNLSPENASFYVNDIAESIDHKLLVASGSGLFEFDPVSKKTTRISSPLLRKEDRVLSVTTDAWGDIWYITKEHLVYYRPQTKQFTLFGQEDGLNTDGELYWLRSFDGKKFYLAQNDRIVTFAPQEVRRPISPVNLYIHSVQVNDSTLASIAGNGGKLNLNYRQNRVLFEFGAINYIKPEQNQYAFRLSGVDDEWVQSTRNYASYSNLAPGLYTFNLKAENSSGLWSKPIKLMIVISPPYWGTWWFKLISIVLTSILFLAAIRFVLQRNLREKILKLEKEQAVEKERNRIARDMHDDLGSGLTKIAVLSEVTKAQIMNRHSATAHLDIISNASRELVDNLQDIIWVLNPRNDSVESLILYMRDYTESFFELTHVNLQFICEEGINNITLSEEKRRNIFLVVKESCNNILKYAECTTVNISIGLAHRLLAIEIADNGKGFDSGHIPVFSNGLTNMKNRMEQTGGKFYLVSAPGKGTQIKCVIPV